MRKELIVGLAFFAAMVLLGLFTIIIADFNPFATTQQMRVRFDDIAGLKRGDEVQVAGAEYGKVRDIRLEDGGIVVDIELRSPVKLHEGYHVHIKSASPLGGRLVTIVPGDPAQPEVDAKQVLSGSSYGADVLDSLYDLIRRVKEGEGTAAKLINDPKLFDDLAAAAASVRRIADSLEARDGFVGKLLAKDSEKLYADAADTMASVREIVAAVGDGEGSLGKLIKDDAAYDSAVKAFRSISDITDELKKAEGVAGALVYDKKMGDELRTTFTKVKDLTTDIADGKGNLGKLIADDTLFAKTQKLLDTLNETADKLATGDGTIARLIEDETLFENARNLFETLNDTAQKLADGDGTLGKLIHDSSLYDAARDLVAQLRQATEDAREQAPISAFGSAILGGFR